MEEQENGEYQNQGRQIVPPDKSGEPLFKQGEAHSDWITQQRIIPPGLSMLHERKERLPGKNQEKRHQYESQTVSREHFRAHPRRQIAVQNHENIPVAVPDILPCDKRPGDLVQVHTDAHEQIQADKEKHGHIKIQERRQHSVSRERINVFLSLALDGLHHAVTRIEKEHHDDQLTKSGPDSIADDVDGSERIGARSLHLQNGMAEEDHEDEQAFDGIRLLPAQEIIIKACALDTQSKE